MLGMGAATGKFGATPAKLTSRRVMVARWVKMMERATILVSILYIESYKDIMTNKVMAVH